MSVVKMENITKRFSEVIANNEVNFELEKGEIHALLGENGAGKTTLMNILYGLYQADRGKIYIRGKETKISSPADAIKQGIGKVPQIPEPIPSLSVAENVALGLRWSKPFFPVGQVAKKIEQLSRRYGLKVNPQASVEQLSVGEQQKVEILKVLARDPEILILDEPTTTLVLPEIEELFSLLRRMTQEGRSVIFIAHKLEEVMTISHRVTILRNGKIVKTLETSKTNKEELIKMMVGEELKVESKTKPVKKKEKALEVRDVWAFGYKKLPAVKGVSFKISCGEVLGIAGVAGNGQRELVEIVRGLRKPIKGKVMIGGEDITNLSPRKILDKGVAYIPEDRRTGIVPSLSVLKNFILINYGQQPFSGWMFLNSKVIGKYARDLVSEYNIATPNLNTPVEFLSGGNRQILILARELSREARVIIAVHPTFGLDVRTTQRIREIFREQQEKGATILLVSEDLEEIVSLSNRIGVMFEGEIRGLEKDEKLTIEEVELLMTGEEVL